MPRRAAPSPRTASTCTIGVALALAACRPPEQAKASDDTSAPPGDTAARDTAADDTGAATTSPCPAQPPDTPGSRVEITTDQGSSGKQVGLYAIGDAECVASDCPVDLWGYVKLKRSDEVAAIRRVTATSSRQWVMDESCGVTAGLVGEWDAGTLGTPSLREADGVWTMWYRADDVTETQVIARATSTDACTWTVDPEPVLSPTESWADKAVIAPHVIEMGDELWMYYRGSRYGNQGESDIGLATSSDGGQTWTPHPDNPIFPRGADTWDASVMADAHVWPWGDRYLMLYSGHDLPSTPEMTFDDVGIGKQIGLAASWDGLSWSRCGDGPVLDYGVKSDNPFVVEADDGVLVYFRTTDREDGSGGKLRLVRWTDWPGEAPTR